MAALCTHDMPTLRGFWHCDDLKMGEELGLYPNKEQLSGLFDSRAESKQKKFLIVWLGMVIFLKVLGKMLHMFRWINI